MAIQAVGIYREPEFSPGKVEADAAIIDASLAELRAHGMRTMAIDAARFIAEGLSEPALTLAMCQSERALSQLAAAEQSGALAINSALAIRNCYRDLLGAGLNHAGVPTPEGAVVRTAQPLDLKPLRALDLSAPMYVKRGDLHALGPHDVQRVEGLEQLEATLLRFARRNVALVYVQQEAIGDVVKFYGVGGGEYFAAVPEAGGYVTDSAKRALGHAAAAAAEALGLEVWGGDAVMKSGEFSIIDFNDWPSFSRVRAEAAKAIARRAVRLMRQQGLTADASA